MSPLAMIIRAVASSMRRLISVLTTFVLTMAIGVSSFAQEPAAPALGPQQLDQLLAPIALYQDSLLGQVLTASTYPLEVVMAARWSAANSNLTGRELEDAMQAQTWDASVKALTAVPQTLQMMNDKLDWTKQLGEAYLAQPDDVTTSIQRLRARADASGNLKASSQLKVSRVPAPPPVFVGAPPEPEYIMIEPVEPDVIFVPIYDPWAVYGVWPYPAYGPFFWYPPGYVSVGVFGFGPPIFVGAALWCNYNWYSRRVEINVARYNAFNRVTLANTAANRTWQHDPGHRGNIAYSTPALQKQFGKTGSLNASRGPNNLRTNQQFLNTKGGTGGGAGAGKTITGTGKTITPGTHLNTKSTSLNSGGTGNQKSGGSGVNRSAAINSVGNKNLTGNNNKGNGNINRSVNRGGNNNFGGGNPGVTRNLNVPGGGGGMGGGGAPAGMGMGPPQH